ncbi:hypothetical protein JCM19992_23170 [Thermostilla marina]
MAEDMAKSDVGRSSNGSSVAVDELGTPVDGGMREKLARYQREVRWGLLILAALVIALVVATGYRVVRMRAESRAEQLVDQPNASNESETATSGEDSATGPKMPAFASNGTASTSLSSWDPDDGFAFVGDDSGSQETDRSAPATSSPYPTYAQYPEYAQPGDTPPDVPPYYADQPNGATRYGESAYAPQAQTEDYAQVPGSGYSSYSQEIAPFPDALHGGRGVPPQHNEFGYPSDSQGYAAYRTDVTGSSNSSITMGAENASSAYGPSGSSSDSSLEYTATGRMQGSSRVDVSQEFADVHASPYNAYGRTTEPTNTSPLPATTPNNAMPQYGGRYADITAGSWEATAGSRTDAGALTTASPAGPVASQPFGNYDPSPTSTNPSPSEVRVPPLQPIPASPGNMGVAERYGTSPSTNTNYRPYVVREGDTLFEIARRELGRASRWMEIYNLNRDRLGDRLEHLHPGTTILLPTENRTAARALGSFPQQ